MKNNRSQIVKLIVVCAICLGVVVSLALQIQAFT